MQYGIIVSNVSPEGWNFPCTSSLFLHTHPHTHSMVAVGPTVSGKFQTTKNKGFK